MPCPSPAARALRGVLVTGALVATTACAPPRPTALQPVKIGAVSSTSGALATFGGPLLKAVELATEQVNAAGGVFDARPLQLVVVDTTSSPDEAQAQARALVDQGVSALVGPETSGQAAKVLEIATAAEIPMVSCCATSTSLSSGSSANGGFFFRTAPSDALQGKALAYIARNGVQPDADTSLTTPKCTNAAIFSRPDAYGEGFRDVFVDAFDNKPLPDGGVGHVIAQGTFPRADADPSVDEIRTSAADFTNAIGAGLSSGPNDPLCVVFITFGAEGAELVGEIEDNLQQLISSRTASDATFTLPYEYITGDGAQEQSFLTGLQTKSAAIRTKLVGTVPTHANSPAYDQFVVAYRARHGEDPPAYGSHAFDAMFVTALAAVRAQSDVGVDVRNALFEVSGRGNDGVRFDDGNFFGEIAARIAGGDEIDYVGPSGELTFDAFGDVQGDYMIWTVRDEGNGIVFHDETALPVSRFNPL